MRRGWCLAHYKRWQRHGDPLAGGTPRGAPLAFLEEAIASETDSCIPWPFATGGSSGGYGVVNIDGEQRYVHRVVCAKVHGEPPTPDHEAAHSCGKGHLGCINWKHLRWATPVENNADKLLHGTDNRGERHGLSKLSDADVREIKRLRGAMTQREIGEMFWVSQANVSCIQRHKAWAWLDAGGDQYAGA